MQHDPLTADDTLPRTCTLLFLRRWIERMAQRFPEPDRSDAVAASMWNIIDTARAHTAGEGMPWTTARIAVFALVLDTIARDNGWSEAESSAWAEVVAPMLAQCPPQLQGIVTLDLDAGTLRADPGPFVPGWQAYAPSPPSNPRSSDRHVIPRPRIAPTPLHSARPESP